MALVPGEPPWVLSWEQVAAGGPRQSGGKGYNLGRLHVLGFPVPAGGVLHSGAYLRFMKAPHLYPLQAALADVTPEQVEEPEVQRRLHELRAAIGAEPLPSDLHDAIAAFLEERNLGGQTLAVRSSAAAEDGALASFAGIHRSFLDCRGIDSVVQGIKGCYASLWTAAALAYRRRLGLADAAVACAVVLCERIEARLAGVAFSCHPRSGRRDQICISAVAGLGDALVSGQVNPDEMTVTWRQGELVLTRQTGRLMSPEEVLVLARLVWRVHWALGEGERPQDVEWAADASRFWLVQSRPVTRLPRIGFAGVRGQPIYWSNGNVKEVVPGVPTTLTWSVLQPALWLLLYAAPQKAGYPVPAGMEMARRYQGRLYFDLTSLQWLFYDSFGVLPSRSNRSIGGHQPEIAVPPGSPFQGRVGWRRLWSMLRLWPHLVRLAWTLPRTMQRIRSRARAAQQEDLRRLTDRQLVDWQFDLGRSFVQFGGQVMLVNGSVEMWLQPLTLLLEWLVPGRGQALAAALMAGSGQVTSAAQGYRLFDLAEAARHDHEARSYLEQAPRDPQGWRRLSIESPFRRQMQRYLRDFGHRAVYEIEAANSRWNEDPSYLLDQVCILLQTSAANPRQAAWRKRDEAQAELAQHSFWLRPLVRLLAWRTARASALREESKSLVVALWEPMRRGMLEAGRRMVEAGILDEPADVFHLTWVDLTAYLLGEWNGEGARSLVSLHCRQRQDWLGQEPPDVIVEEDDGSMVCPADVSPTTSRISSAGTFQGIAAAAGRATGRARILRHPHDGGALQPSEVLVAPSTDPGWTPLFLRAAALVTEVGGYLSHTAIVAREYGIPAVVNVPGVLQQVRDGQMLTVDGDQGWVIFEDDR